MKTVTIDIDGVKRTFGPLLAATVRDHAEQIRRATQGEMTDVTEQIDMAAVLATASLRRVDPAITEQQVLGWVDMGNYTRYYAAAMGQTLPEEAPAEGEAQAGSHSG